MAMSELKQKLLLYELAQIGLRDAEYIPTSDKIKTQPNDSRMPTINDVGDIHYGTEHNSFVINTLEPIVRMVNETIAAWEKSQAVPFENLSQFRVLAEYNNIILAARDDTVYGRGLHFVTWQYDYDRTGLEHGHYTEDYNYAKEDFAKRSGLMPSEKVFTQEQAAEIRKAIDFRLNNGDDLTYDEETELMKISERLITGYELPKEAPAQPDAPETSIHTTQAINGAVFPPKQTLTERLKAAGVQAKEQDSHNNSAPQKQTERE